MKSLSFNLSLTTEGYDYPVRLDRALRDFLNQNQKIPLSRAEMKAIFDEDNVLLSGRIVHAQTLLSPGEYLIEIKLPENTGQTHEARPSTHLTASILYEDSDILVLNKPSGVPSVPHSSEETETAVGIALRHCPQIMSVGRTTLEPGLLHRLDTETSGALVFAKTESEFHRLRSEWKSGSTQKIYRALVDSFQPLPLRLPYSIELPIGHDQKSSKRMRIATQDQLYRVRGKPLEARTEIINIERVDSLNIPHEAPVFDLTIQIYTGVMHQIRVHLSSLSWPILGDQTYHNSFRKHFLPSTRLWLHAWKLTLPLKNGNPLHIIAPLPDGWPKQINQRSQTQ